FAQRSNVVLERVEQEGIVELLQIVAEHIEQPGSYKIRLERNKVMLQPIVVGPETKPVINVSDHAAKLGPRLVVDGRFDVRARQHVFSERQQRKREQRARYGKAQLGTKLYGVERSLQAVQIGHIADGINVAGVFRQLFLCGDGALQLQLH